MAWLGLISLGLMAEVSVIIMLGRWGTHRYEAGHDQGRNGSSSTPQVIGSVVVHAADGGPAAGFPSVAEPEVA
jgi:hypothetical protein